MQFGQILKNILDKNQEVWIPTIGLLSYDKATSKLNLDTYGSASDSDLIQLISDIKQVSLGEAKGILIQEVEGIKSEIRTQGKFIIENTGELSLNAGSFVFESKKTLFPTDFFGGGNFNPNSFSNNKPKVEEVKPILLETPKEVEAPIIEVKSQLDNFLVVEASKIIEEASKIVEEKENLKESIEVTKEEKTGFFDKVKNLTKSKKIDPSEEQNLFTEQIILSDKEDVKEEIIEKNSPEIIEIEDKISNQDILDEETFEKENLIEDKVEEPIDFIYESKEEPIIETENKIEQIVITEPRRNIGNSRYDEGFYEFTGSIDENTTRKKWLIIGLLSIAIIGFGLIGAWFASNYFNKKKAISKEVPVVKPIDTVSKTDTTSKLDSTKSISTVDSFANNAAIAKPIAPIPTTNSKATSTTPASKQPSTQPTQTTSTNTQPKTPSSGPASKKSVAVATKTTNNTTEVKGTKPVDVAPKVAKVKDTTTKLKASKEPKYNVIGKPYATANYTKGNYYLSFGKFKIASAASKLKKDMKGKAGVETDIILLDGSYHVVIPYVNKEKAQSASKDYPSTTLFE